MSWILGIDTSSIDLGVGLYKDNLPVVSYSRFVKNSHAEHIAQLTMMLFELNKVDPKAINYIAIATGPGSFTGLRICIAFVQGFCFGRETQVCALSSLFILAHNALQHHGRIVSVIDARNNSVYWASFSNNHGVLTRETSDSLATTEHFLAALQPDDAVVTDTMGYAKSTVFTLLPQKQKVFSVEAFPMQRGLICAQAGAAGADNPALWCDAHTIAPNYLRRPLPEERYLAGFPS